MLGVKHSLFTQSQHTDNGPTSLALTVKHWATGKLASRVYFYLSFQKKKKKKIGPVIARLGKTGAGRGV